jgi:hypothetical protein
METAPANFINSTVLAFPVNLKTDEEWIYTWRLPAIYLQDPAVRVTS